MEIALRDEDLSESSIPMPLESSFLLREDHSEFTKSISSPASDNSASSNWRSLVSDCNSEDAFDHSEDSEDWLQDLVSPSILHALET